MIRTKRTVILLLIGTLALGYSEARGQDLSLPEQTYVNTFARPGQPTITVYLWGTVGSPGIWRIERDTDLVTFLSAVQVPGLGTEDQNVRRRFELHIYRTSNGERQQIYEERVENLIAGGAKPPPALQEGDVISIQTETRRRINSRTVLEIVRTATSLLTLYFIIDRQLL